MTMVTSTQHVTAGVKSFGAVQRKARLPTLKCPILLFRSWNETNRSWCLIAACSSSASCTTSSTNQHLSTRPGNFRRTDTKYPLVRPYSLLLRSRGIRWTAPSVAAWCRWWWTLYERECSASGATKTCMNPMILVITDYRSRVIWLQRHQQGNEYMNESYDVSYISHLRVKFEYCLVQWRAWSQVTT